MAHGSAPPSFWDRVKQPPVWIKIVVPRPGGPCDLRDLRDHRGDNKKDNGSGGNEATANSVVLDDAGSKTAPAPTTGPTEDDFRNALDDAVPTNYGAVAEDVKVKQIEIF
jgi:hypothetical protein